jgi:macrolide transport system ATP-binding/permease protein
MLVLTVETLQKSYGLQTVLHNVSFTLATGQRIGIVGANGVGKSTLAHIIAGQIEADGGTVRLHPSARLGYLPQDDSNLTGTLQSQIEGALAHLTALENEMRALEARMSDATGEALDAVLARYGEATDAFERGGGWDAEARVGQVLAGLRIDYLPRGRDLATFSGGERARVQLALLLLSAPDVLLLDEPTNHLDAASLDWLEDYVGEYPGAALIVSHDRAFLNAVVTSILEIDEHTHAAKPYTGDYDAYVRAKQIERVRWQQEWEQQQDEIKELRIAAADEIRAMGQTKATRKVGGDKFAKGFFKARTETGITRKLDNVKARLERIEADPVSKPPKPLQFNPSFDPASLDSRSPLFVSGVSKSYGARTILRDVTFTLNARSRIAIVGPNGAGKSTLLRILAGVEAPDRGEVSVNPQVQIGYLDQDGEDLNDDVTVVEAYGEGIEGTDQAHVSDLLVSGLFRYDEVRRPVNVLSGGQRRKLQIARLIAMRANLLLLDEPTNTLSFDVLEAFEAALRDFPGPVIAATHDRRFLESFGGEIWELRDGLLVPQAVAAVVQ